MNVELVQMTNDTAIWATGLGFAAFVILLFLKPGEDEMKGIQQLAARLDLLFCVVVGAVWILSNFVTPA